MRLVGQVGKEWRGWDGDGETCTFVQFTSIHSGCNSKTFSVGTSGWSVCVCVVADDGRKFLCTKAYGRRDYREIIPKTALSTTSNQTLSRTNLTAHSFLPTREGGKSL